jgi:hypothetical protein
LIFSSSAPSASLRFLLGALGATLASLIGCASGGNPHAANTVGEQCTEIFVAYCSRMVDECGANVDVQADGGTDDGAGVEGGLIGECVATVLPVCCGAYCAAAAISSEGSIQACIADLGAFPCADLSVTVPASCVGVVRHP